jgi:hypothetical protein
MYWLVLAIIAADLLLRLLRRRPGQSLDREGAEPIGYLRILVNAVAFLTLGAAAATSLFAPPTGLAGDALVRHVTVAPAFALAATVLALFWAHRNRFAAADGGRLASPATWAAPLRKFFFWAAVALTVPTLLSVLAAMFPLFDTGDQQKLLSIHRTCGPLLVCAGSLFTYFALVTWWERSKD